MRLISMLALVGGCAFDAPPGGDVGDGDGDGDGDGVVHVSVRGTVVDFVGGAEIDGATLELVDLPGGEIAVSGSEFTITGVLAQSVFRVRATAASYATTLSALISVGDDDVDGELVELVAQSLVDDAYADAGISPSGGILAARLFDPSIGAPAAGVEEAAFTDGPATAFLGTNLEVFSGAPATTDTGIAFVLNVAEGLVEMQSGVGEHFFTADATRVEDGSVSIVDIDVGVDPPQIPANVFFDPDVLAVFAAKGCNGCHRGANPGQPFFSLNGDTQARYQTTLSKIDQTTPDVSLLLNKPRFEDPPDAHQIVFANRYDPDYLTLLGWISNGAEEDD